jgi:hypothetical protein
MHNINNLSVQDLFFPVHDEILFQQHGKSLAQDLQLGVVECKVYHNILLNTKSQIDFDFLLQLHSLDETEEDNRIICFGKKCKLVEYSRGKKEDDHCSNHKFLVEWNDINQTKSWVNFLASSISNPKPIISSARSRNHIDLIEYAFLSPHSVL